MKIRLKNGFIFPFLGLLVASFTIVGVHGENLTPPAPSPAETQIKVACTSGILASFVGTIAGIEIDPIIDSGTCPAHYEVQPEDAALVASADLIFYHGFEGDWFTTLVNENNPSAQLIKMDDLASGPWLPPSQAITYLTAICQKLNDTYPSAASDFNTNLATYTSWINGNATALKEDFKASPYYQANACVMMYQSMFASWLGLNVCLTFGSDEGLSAQDIVWIVNNATRDNCTLVIMNLPSGTSAGKDLAAQIGAKYAIWGNFVGELGSTDYIDLITKNVAAVKTPVTPGENDIGIPSELSVATMMAIGIGIIFLKKKRVDS
ncbi:MAG: metal ABC transporter substrate-binding protein [Promethearchaeota archaeon]